MPWKLTTPINVGDLDTTPYGEIKIVRQAHDSVRGLIVVDIEYGNTVGNKWVSGLPIRSRPSSVMISGTDYVTLVSTAAPEAQEKTYEAVKRGLYKFLADKGVIGPGTIV